MPELSMSSSEWRGGGVGKAGGIRDEPGNICKPAIADDIVTNTMVTSSLKSFTDPSEPASVIKTRYKGAYFAMGQSRMICTNPLNEATFF